MGVATYDQVSRFRWSSEDPSEQFNVINPATAEVITTVQGGGTAQVKAAVEKSQTAFQAWKLRAPSERGMLLLKAAQTLESHTEELAKLLSMENGKPVTQAMGDVLGLIMGFRYFGSLIGKISSEFHDQGSLYASVVYEPHGVVAAILPFNWPPIHVGGKVAPALAAGNTVILKPGEQAPLTVLRIVHIIEDVFPADVIQVIPAAGPVVPQSLVTHPFVRYVSFTGSTKAGKAVGKTAADSITPLSLELGGKNAFIVYDDADLDQVVQNAIEGGFFNQGEACTAASRILCQQGIHDAFVAKLAAAVKRLKVGDGADKGTHVGPLVTQQQQKQVLEYIRIGLEEGAKIAAQAKLPSAPGLQNGFFAPPTLFTNVERHMRIAREEIFGPVVTVTKFVTHEEAIAITNESEYGLVCSIHTREMSKAFRASREVDVGIVFINNYHRNLLGTPFGGVKQSGYGREHCIQTLREYAHAKNIRFPSGLGTVPTWAALPDLFGPETNGVSDGQHLSN